MSSRFHIERLGAQGDGVARDEGAEVFIPFTLPGETVTAVRSGDRAELMAVLESSALRVAPPCRHFGTCGGCALQHLQDQSYQAWKRERVVQALRARKIQVEVEPLVACQPGSRRRAVFTARHTEAGMLLGFNRHLSHGIVALEECHVVVPQIAAALGMLRALAALACNTRKPFQLAVTATLAGFDIAVREAGPMDEKRRRSLIDLAIREGLARLSMDGEVVVEPKKPVVTFGSVVVSPPPGVFLQATEAAEAAMAGLVASHLLRAKRVADLFSGCGSFALRLAARAEVHAVESDAEALAALDRGFRFATGLKRVTVERRDLFRRPLTVKELDAFDGLVFDPPRAGAEDQSKQIARSQVPLVAAVSCNPATLARDLRILLDGGYALKSVTPIDQFLWSPHVEAVALLEKPRRRR
jgi:23S rRNA (uracil1939-C5)-methyltransferase